MWAENGKNRNKMKVQFTVEINNNIVTYKINILKDKYSFTKNLLSASSNTYFY